MVLGTPSLLTSIFSGLRSRWAKSGSVDIKAGVEIPPQKPNACVFLSSVNAQCNAYGFEEEVFWYQG